MEASRKLHNKGRKIKWDKDITHRITQGKIAIQIQALNSLLWSSQTKMKSKLMMYKSNVEHITIYALECWAATQANKKKIEAVQMDFYAKSLSCIKAGSEMERTNYQRWSKTIYDYCQITEEEEKRDQGIRGDQISGHLWMDETLKKAIGKTEIDGSGDARCTDIRRIPAYKNNGK